MGSKKPLKIEALVVTAIKRLRNTQGSSPREISNYISQGCGVPASEIRKQVQLALKRGVTYGILQCLKGGHYTCNRDFVTGPSFGGGDGITTIPCHGRSRRRKRYGSGRRAKRRRSSRKSKSRRRRRRSRRRSRPGMVTDVDAAVTEDPSKEENNSPARMESASSMASSSDDWNPDDPTGEDPAALNAQGSVE